MSNAPDERPRRAGHDRLVRAAPVAAVVVAMAVTAAVTWAVVHTSPARTHAGALYPASGLHPVHTASVHLPWGTLGLGVTAPRASLPAEVAHSVGRTSVPAPRGGAFVGVTTTVHSSDSARAGAVAATRTLVALVVDGRRFPLSSPTGDDGYCPTACTDGGPVWVGVTGDTTKLGFAVGYDGVTQTVDALTGRVDPGRAAPLYTAATTTSSPRCSAPVWSGGFSTEDATTCELTVTRSPYLAGLGWAPTGTLWVGVVAALAPPYSVQQRGDRDDVRHYVPRAGTTVDYRLGGGTLVRQGPQSADTGQLGPATQGGTVYDAVAFRVPASAGPSTLTVTAHYLVERDRETATAANSRATETWTVTA